MISAVRAGPSVSSAAEREGRVGRRSSVLLHSSGGGAYGPEEVRAGLWGRGWGAVLSGTDVEGVAVCLRGGDHVGAAAGAAHPGGLGAAVSGGRGGARDMGVECVELRMRGGDHVGAESGAAHPGGLGAAVSGGRSAAGQLGVECVSTAARAGTERRLYAGAGDGAADEVGTIGTGGDRLDADSGGGFAQPAGDRRTAAPGAEPAAAEHSPVAEAVR